LREILRNRWVKFILFLVGLGLVLYFAYRLRSVLAAVVLSFLLAYLTNPIVDTFQKRLRFPRTLAVAATAVLLVIFILALIAVIIPLFAKQVMLLGQKLPDYINRLQDSSVPQLGEWLERLGLKMPTTYDELLTEAKKHKELLQDWGSRIFSPVMSYLQAVFSGVMNTILGLLQLLIVPVAWFYLVKDWHKIKDRVVALIPPIRRDAVVGYATKVHKVLSDFLSGQIVVCLLLGLLYALGLQFVAKVPLGFLVGILAGLLSIVPYLGFIVGIFPALALAFLEHGDWQHPALVVAVFAVAQALEGNVITPKIVGSRVGLHPVIVIFSLLIFGELFGFLGILIAVPVTAVVMVFIREGVERYKQSKFYAVEAGENSEG